MLLRRSLLPLIALLALAGPITAQGRSTAFPRWQSPLALPASGPAREYPRDTPRLVLGGLLGGVLGLIGGGFIGSTLGGGNSLCGDDPCGLEGAAWGALAGESTLLPLGVHLANERKGNYGLSLLASLAIGAVGAAAVDATGDGWPLIGVPIGQLVSSILIERATSR